MSAPIPGSLSSLAPAVPPPQPDQTTPPSVGAEQIAKSALTFYFAGGLFDSHQLEGNARLCHAIEQLSDGRYNAHMPQNVELRDFSPQGIRDQDLQGVLNADICIFQLNGAELDSGTLIELMYAKMAGIPSLLLRTDFRSGGDQGEGGDPWNLMVSNFPGCEVVVIDSMKLYKSELGTEGGASVKQSVDAAARMTNVIAKRVIIALDRLSKAPPLMPKEMQKTVYRWLAMFPGFKEGGAAMQDFTAKALARKQELGLM